MRNSEKIIGYVLIIVGILCWLAAIKVAMPLPWPIVLAILGSILGIIGIFASGYQMASVEFECFVATAVYQSRTHPDVLLFKRFRDKILLKILVGKLIVQIYYLIGPYLAKLVILLGLKNFMYKQLSILASWIRKKYKL